MSTRRATHCGSWYESDPRVLGQELDNWLAKVGPANHGPARAIIAPHAGYRYSGPCASYCYKQIDPRGVERVFILGPSHKFRLDGCAVSACAKYETPFYDLKIDQATNQELLATGEFEVMTLDADENEHSIEMHLPYTARVMQTNSNFQIVPILVGSLSEEKHLRFGKILAKYLADPKNVFIISSDFCHWGDRFRYTHYDEKCGQIHESIKALDMMGMNLIEQLDLQGFNGYLRKYSNTICGRNPISVFLGAVQALRAQNGRRMNLKFLNYDQSNSVVHKRDSSVSYAAASFLFE